MCSNFWLRDGQAAGTTQLRFETSWGLLEENEEAAAVETSSSANGSERPDVQLPKAVARPVSVLNDSECWGLVNSIHLAVHH